MPTPRKKSPAAVAAARSKRLAALDPEVVETMLGWCDFTYDDWAGEFIADINDGNYDDLLPDVVNAANRRLALVLVSSRTSSDDKAIASEARRGGMMLAARIVFELGLTERIENVRHLKSGKTVDKSFDKVLGVTPENWTGIISDYGDAYKNQLHEKLVATHVELRKKEVEAAKRAARVAINSAKASNKVDLSPPKRKRNTQKRRKP